MIGIHNIHSASSRPGYYRPETHDIIIPRILHVKQNYADWENGDWVFNILLDREKYIFHIRTAMNNFGAEWQVLVVKKYGNSRDSKADRDEDLAKELPSYKLAEKKRVELLSAINAYHAR